MRRTAIMAMVLLGAAAVWAQSPRIIQNARNNVNTAQKTWNAQQGVVGSAAASAASPAGAPAASVPDANKLLPKDAVGTVAGEEHMSQSAKRDANRRDPFLSPVVTRVGGGGAGCSGGKRCLAADSISLRGIVRSHDGMIAVVVNAANKAYFLRENDPIFNGFVARITDDSMVLRETVQDVLGRKSTRDVVKKLFVPAV
ncbi:MAG TPA: hypothetical protein VFK81_04255 [Terriglobales bacterium]|nr:hypothetical protein [Terriglobales bacterium]